MHHIMVVFDNRHMEEKTMAETRRTIAGTRKMAEAKSTVVRNGISLAERAARLAGASAQQKMGSLLNDKIQTLPKKSLTAPVLHTIEPLPSVPTEQRLRVAAYCRTSRDTESQRTSIKSQREHWRKEIESHDGWELVDVYWESGVTGTKKEIRPELIRLMGDCEAHRVDMVVTKSVSRFARNTADCLELLRKLKALNVRVWFQKEKIDTGTAGGELLLTLYASFAEEESRSIQSNTTWGIQRRFQDGTRRYSKAPFGYDLVDGNFVVNQEQAPIVREIFTGVLSGKGTPLIARELNSREIPTGTKKWDGTDGTWTSRMILGIVKNVVYLGDVLMQKTFHDENFKQHYNYGEKQQYYIDGHHEAILDAATFEAANSALRQRGIEKNNIPQEDRRLRADKHQRRYAFSGKLKCGYCGATMKRTTSNKKYGTCVCWVCTRHQQDKSACTMKGILDAEVKNAFLTMLNKLYFARDTIIPAYAEQIRREEQEGQIRREEQVRQEEEVKREEGQVQGDKKWIKREEESPNGEMTLQAKIKKNMEECKRLTAILKGGCGEPVSIRSELHRLERENRNLRNTIQANHHMVDEIAKLKRIVTGRGICSEWDEETFTELVDHVDVVRGESICFYLKCGMKLTEKMA